MNYVNNNTEIIQHNEIQDIVHVFHDMNGIMVEQDALNQEKKIE
jgi:hypothetical protein